MKILSRPKGNAEEYGRWSVNPYKGCPHGCLYCYLKKGAWAKGLGGNMPVLKEHIVNEEHAYYLAMAEITEHKEEILRDGGLFMSFVTDPMCRYTKHLFLRIAGTCMCEHIPVMVLTKSTDFYPLYNSIPSPQYDANSRYIAFGFTLTGHDELEPNAPSNESRIETMRKLSDDGFQTWASIEPVITFDSSFEMIRQALDAGCQHFKIGLMTKNTKVCRNGFSYGGNDFAPYDLSGCCQFVYYVMVLTERYGATVYWKQSFVDFLQVSKKDPQPAHGMTASEFLTQWPHSVGKDWSIFNQL